MPDVKIPIPNGESIQELYDTMLQYKKNLEWLLNNLDSMNVSEITTEYTKVHSELGETIIDGPILKMNDKNLDRLMLGYDSYLDQFLFRMWDKYGDLTIDINDLGEAVFKGNIQTLKDALIGLNLTIGNPLDFELDREIRFANNVTTGGFDSIISWRSNLLSLMTLGELYDMGYTDENMPGYSDGIGIKTDNIDIDVRDVFVLNSQGIYLDSGLKDTYIDSQNITLNGDLIQLLSNEGLNIDVADNYDINISTGGTGNINFSLDNGSCVLPDYSYLIDGTDEDYRIMPEYAIRNMIDNAVSTAISTAISDHVSMYHSIV